MALTRGMGLRPTSDYSLVKPTDAIVLTRPPGEAAILLDPRRRRGTPRPCLIVDGVGVYFIRGRPAPDGRNTVYCPA
jgi:hypothetical protein